MMNTGGMSMGFSRADARAFAGKAADDTRIARERLPLPKKYFSKLRLSSAMVCEYQATAKSLLDDALEQLRRERVYGGIDETEWRDVGAASGFKRYTKTDGDEQHFRVQGTVRASLSGLMKVLFAENDRRLAARRTAVYNDLLDVQTLCVLKDRTTAENEHMAIRWLAIELSASSDAHRRDMCVLEYTGTTRDRENQLIGFKVSHSIQVAECPSLKQTHGLLRRVGTDVLLVRPASDNGHTEILLRGTSDAASEVSAWLLSSYMSTIATALGKLPVVVQERCLASMPLLDPSYWVPTADRKSCHVCVSKFGYLSKKHNCRACGEVTCKSCIVMRTVGDAVAAKFCKKCIIVATHQDDAPHNRSDASGSFASRCSITSVTSTASSTTFQPTTGQQAPAKFHVDMKLLDDLRRESSFAATEDSYGSSTGSLTLDAAERMDAAAYHSGVASLDEDHVMFVDTRDMHRHVGDSTHNSSSSRGHQQPQPHHAPSYSQQSQQQPNYGHKTHQQLPRYTSQNTQQPQFHTAPGGYNIHATANAGPMNAPVASLQHVEDSIAHQRQLLEKMMYQARYKAAATYQ